MIDSDDYLPDDISIEYLMEAAKGYDILQGNHVTTDPEGNAVSESKFEGLSGFAWGKIYHYSVFDHFRFPEGYWFEDTPVKFIISAMGLKIRNLNKCVYCHRRNPEGISSRALNQRKSVDTYWITEQCLQELPAFGIEYDQDSFNHLLHQSIINMIRTRKQPRRIRKALFILTAELVEKYFPNQKSIVYSEIENAIRNKQFFKYELSAIAEWCNRK